MFKIQVRGANGYVVDFEIHKNVVTLGRDPESDVFLPSQLASRNHARIFFRNGEMVIEDLQSSNGTFIRKEPVRIPTPITSDDPIKLGDVYIRVSYHAQKGSQDPNNSGEYSVAQRLGNNKKTAYFGSDDTHKIRSMLASGTGPFATKTKNPKIDEDT